MKKWSEEAWEKSLPIVEQIKQLPFLRELSDGTLPQEIFRYYISQDNLYIDIYTRVLAHIASRLPEMADVATFLEFAASGVVFEKELHAGYNPDPTLPKSDACQFYTSYLRARSQSDVAVEAAAILPCFWVYLEVGLHILATANLDGNPYRRWIETYSAPVFVENTRKAIEICDRLADNATEDVRRQMTDTFLDCTRLEKLFWESAYCCGNRDNDFLTKC